MEILEKPYGMRAGFAPLDNIGYVTFEVSLEGEVYTYSISNKAERVGNKWRIIKYDFLGNPIECVIPRDMLVGFAWYNIKESLLENSIYADTIRRYKEFFSISYPDKDRTDYKTSKGFHYYVTRFGEVWSTESMTKLKGGVKHGYRHVRLGSANNVKVHRLVAHHFVPKPKDLVDQGLNEKTLVVNHLDGNKLNNRWDNLEWTTNDGNMAHASATGLMHTTIADHVLERIWQLLQEGYPDTYISKVTGVPRPTVSAIRRGTKSRYITDKYTWPKHSGNKLDEDTIRSIYDDFINTNMSNSEIARKYNVSDQYIYDLRRGRAHAKLAYEYITSKGLDGYWKGYRHTK